MAARFSEIVRMSVLPPPEQYTRATVTLPDKTLERAEKAREHANANREKPDRLSRDRFFQLMLEWALGQYEATEMKRK